MVRLIAGRKLCRATLLAAGLMYLAASPAAVAQQGWDHPDQDVKPSKKLNINPALDPYTAGMQAKEKGDYDRAISLFAGLAVQGHGFEMAQLEMGDTFLMKSRQLTDPEAAGRMVATGIGWMLRAAAGGLGAADERLVRLYLDGQGLPADKPEAGKWYVLWHRSPSRMQIGMGQFDIVLEQRLKAALQPSDWQEAQKRADAPYHF